ncbi:glycoside hydrolase superfamily [Sporodiniella umbellata]|nr:glycoside hydrolase superfamily [Sporodiniella umbellata]
MSMGGAAGEYHTQKWEPDLLAWWLWNKFLGGEDRTVQRPFGKVVLDGIDYDPEEVHSTGYDQHIHTLRQLFKTQYPPRHYLITAAPQCSDLEYYKKNALYSILHPSPKYDSHPDMVFVQFYNNYCSASNHGQGSDFNYKEWEQWAKETTQGRTQIMLGVLGRENHMDTGYVSYEKLTTILDDIQASPHFGGVMIWDAGYAYANTIPYFNSFTYGQATAKYLDRLSHPRLNLVETARMMLEQKQVPVMTPVLADPTMPCAGQLFMLLQSVRAGLLAESLGTASNVIDQRCRLQTLPFYEPTQEKIETPSWTLQRQEGWEETFDAVVKDLDVGKARLQEDLSNRQETEKDLSNEQGTEEDLSNEQEITGSKLSQPLPLDVMAESWMAVICEQGQVLDDQEKSDAIVPWVSHQGEENPFVKEEEEKEEGVKDAEDGTQEPLPSERSVNKQEDDSKDPGTEKSSVVNEAYQETAQVRVILQKKEEETLKDQKEAAEPNREQARTENENCPKELSFKENPERSQVRKEKRYSFLPKVSSPMGLRGLSPVSYKKSSGIPVSVRQRVIKPNTPDRTGSIPSKIPKLSVHSVLIQPKSSLGSKLPRRKSSIV